MSRYHEKSHRPSTSLSPTFEWRASLGPWRWLILGSLGVAPSACGARAERDAEQSTANLLGQGGGPVDPDANPGTTPANPGFGGTGAGLPTAGVGGSAALPPPSRASACVPESSPGGGWVRCTNGMLHRPEQGTCSSKLPRADHDVKVSLGIEPGADAGVALDCALDSDCTDDTYGHCELGQGGPYCIYGCVIDADCDANQVCSCGPDIGECRPAECSVDADCGGSSLCGSYEVEPNCGGTSFGCQTSADECAGDLDCGNGGYCVREISYSSDYETRTEAPNRTCNESVCVIGRPFLIDGAERTAPSAVRCDWYEGAHVARTAAPVSSAALRDAIARGWTEQALMEHASVAAFARFSLQLLSLGAPAELVAAAATAMQDEIRHARSCFELARRHLDRDVGPGPLAIDGALDEADLCSIVLCAVREGCVGETVAALEAAEALEHCEDSVARSVLEAIAVEEGRHAELAWRFVAWALASHPELAPHVQEAFATELAGVRPQNEGRLDTADFDRELVRHGLLSATLRAALRERVLSAVVAPCAEALLANMSHQVVVQRHGTLLSSATQPPFVFESQ